MNTIPTIFNQQLTPYTVVGARENSSSRGISSSGVSAIVLNRPGFVRRQFFQELEKNGFDNIVSIETASPHYDIEELSGRFPFVRFVLPEKEASTGELINLAASEIESPLFLVLRSDLKVVAGGTAKKMAERLSINDKEGKKTGNFKRLCTVPVIVNSHYEPSMTLRMPVTHKKKMRTVIREPRIEGQLSLYPFDGIGIYDRRRFVQMGGFDTTLKNTYWQFLDFGFRAYLWGEEIALSLQLKLLCEGDFPVENYTADEDYRRFFLRNLAPVFRGDHADLPYRRFLPFLFRSREDISVAWKEFSESRDWVDTNKFRWKCDSRSVIKHWDDELARNP